MMHTPDGERVRGHGERGARLPHPAQVRRREQHDEAERELDPVGCSAGNALMTLSTPEDTDTATVIT